MTDAMLCSYPGCAEMALYGCDLCYPGNPFCPDHGTPGGDREGDEGRLTEAVPSQCFQCGGFNADAD